MLIEVTDNSLCFLKAGFVTAIHEFSHSSAGFYRRTGATGSSGVIDMLQDDAVICSVLKLSINWFPLLWYFTRRWGSRREFVSWQQMRMDWDCMISATVVRRVRLLPGLWAINASSLTQIHRSRNYLENKFEILMSFKCSK